MMYVHKYMYSALLYTDICCARGFFCSGAFVPLSPQIPEWEGGREGEPYLTHSGTDLQRSARSSLGLQVRVFVHCRERESERK